MSNKSIFEVISSLDIDDDSKNDLVGAVTGASCMVSVNDFYHYILAERFLKLRKHTQSEELSFWNHFFLPLPPKLSDLPPLPDPSYNYRQFDQQQNLLNEVLVIKEKLESLTEYNKEIKGEIDDLKVENNRLKTIFYDHFRESNNSNKTKQLIPVEIYLDTNDNKDIFKVYIAVLDFIKAIDFEVAFEFEAVKGSWFKKLLAKSHKALTSEEVTDRLKEIEYGVEVNTILKQQSEIDKNQSESLLNILSSVQNVPNAAIRIGSLIVVKITSIEGEVNVQARSLSIKELYILNKKPELLHKPQSIFSALTKEVNLEDDTFLN